VISNAAIGRIGVLGLVYTAAYVPDTNETIESVSIVQHAGSTTVQLDDANHAGGFTHCATRFARLIEQAVVATAG
jgi:hypothetical protein